MVNLEQDTQILDKNNDYCENILVIDDSEDNLILFSRIIKKNGYNCFVASDGYKGLSLINENKFDLIMLDMMMPGIGGIEVLKELRRTHSPSTLPVIMVTARNEAELVIEALSLGANDYIIMPTDLQVLMARAALHLRAKRAEDVILHAQRELEERVAERTRELRRKNKKLAELYNTAHQFVDNVSHEFRTPLTVIKEFASILSDGLAGDLTEEQVKYLGIILNRVDDLSLMVDDMLDIGKLEAGLLSVKRREYQATEIVDRVRTIMERKASSCNVTFSTSVSPELPNVYCDIENIGRAIINLVVNACKFSREQGRVELWARYDESNSHVIFGVTDNGPGIAPEDVERIFERFKQVGDDTRASNKGFGLGLNIVRELVHVNLGEITVNSKLGEGSTFAFTVPVYDPMRILYLYLNQIDQTDTDLNYISLFKFAVDTNTELATCDQVNEFLQNETRRSDLLFRMSSHTWIVCAPVNQMQLQETIDRILGARDNANRNRPDGLLPDIDASYCKTWKRAESQQLISAFQMEWAAAAASGTVGLMRRQEVRGTLNDATRPTPATTHIAGG